MTRFPNMSIPADAGCGRCVTAQKTLPMYLLLGHREDPCCAGVFARLGARGLAAHIVGSPLAPPARLTWRLDATGLASRLYPVVPDRDIAGVPGGDTGSLER